MFVIVTELLGPTLEELHAMCGGHFTLPTITRLGLQLSIILKNLHKKGFVHLDVCPQHLCMGLADTDQLFLIDFSQARKYLDEKGLHKSEYQGGKPLASDMKIRDVPQIGNPEFSSPQLMAGESLGSRRDDALSAFYVIANWGNGVLPWTIDEDLLKDEDEQDEEDINVNNV